MVYLVTDGPFSGVPDSPGNTTCASRWLLGLLNALGAGRGRRYRRVTGTYQPLDRDARLLCYIAYLLLVIHMLLYGPAESWVYNSFLLIIFWLLVLDFRSLPWLLAAALPLYLACTLVIFKIRLYDWWTRVTSPLTSGLTAEQETLSE
jgi:hypothetical protein